MAGSRVLVGLRVIVDSWVDVVRSSLGFRSKFPFGLRVLGTGWALRVLDAIKYLFCRGCKVLVGTRV